MPGSVIDDAIRTPIVRAAKVSLKDVRTDDLAAVPLRALVERNPEIDFGETNDLMMGCGFQLGEAGYNVGRNAALLAGIDHHVPATTINRFCASSLQAIRMAFHAIKAGEGDQYIAAGVEAVSRFPQHPPFDPHPSLSGGDGAPYNVYIPMGLTAENVAERCSVSREAQDEWAVTSQRRAVAARPHRRLGGRRHPARDHGAWPDPRGPQGARAGRHADRRHRRRRAQRGV